MKDGGSVSRCCINEPNLVFGLDLSQSHSFQVIVAALLKVVGSKLVVLLIEHMFAELAVFRVYFLQSINQRLVFCLCLEHDF